MSSVRISPRAGGGVVLEAWDWPYAPWFAAALLAPSLPLLVWSVVERRAVEGGGAAVLCAIALFAALLALRGRRRVTFLPGEPARADAEFGAGPFRRRTALEIGAAARLEVRDLPALAGAHATPTQGADLVLVDGDRVLRLARRIGADRSELESACRTLAATLALS